VEWAKQEEFVLVGPGEDRRGPLVWTAKGSKVTPAHGEVKLGKQGPGIAFASATWIYSSTKLQDAHPSDLVSIDRKYFLEVHQADGDHLVPLTVGDKVHVGDEIEVRLAVKAKSQFEYVHVKEPRGAGFEETALTSGWLWDRLAMYQEPHDSLSNFFISWLPQGEYELHHTLRPTTPGRYRIGSAVLQSMYSPDITAYSSGMELEVIK
jgi:alpha-2-macroglobulin